MPQFISKLQYKNYEKGEYSGEKARSLDETLQLIKTFPWQQQRGTDVQLTGPSVTILDDNGNYLKAGLYFGDKYCLYYFTCDHHLYERHVETYEEIATAVTAFFNGQIDLEKFERTRTLLDAATHFENGSFGYQVSSTKIYGRFVLLICLSLFLIIDCSFILITEAPLAAKLFFPAFVLLMIGMMVSRQYMAFQYYRRCKNTYLELSAGRSTFRFGEDQDIAEYNKSDITAINVYGVLTGKSTPILTICELVFTNGTTIKLPGLLIDPFKVTQRFIGIKANQFNRWREYKAEQSAFARGQ